MMGKALKYGLALLSTLLLVVTVGCATLADARAAKGHGMGHTYDVAFDTVWETVPKAAEAVGLKIAGDNKPEGYILAQKGVTPWSVGENIVVYVEKVNDKQTKVEVISKKALAIDLLARNWEKSVLNKLSQMLKEKQ